MDKPKIRNVAVVIFHDNQGNIGVQDRKSHSKAGERYGFWGGKIEDGESPDEAMHRELIEEIGYVPEKLSFWTNFTFVVNIDGKYKDWEINHDVFLSPITERLMKTEVFEGDGVEIMSFERALAHPDFRFVKPLLLDLQKRLL